MEKKNSPNYKKQTFLIEEEKINLMNESLAQTIQISKNFVSFEDSNQI